MRSVIRRQLDRGYRLSLQQLEDRTLLSASYIPNELLVRFDAGVDAAARAEIRAQLGASLMEDLSGAAIGVGSSSGTLERLRLSTGLSVVDAERLVEAIPGVLYAEPNYLLTAQFVSNDTEYVNGKLWGMFSDDVPTPVGPAGTTNPFGIHAEKAWNAGFVGSSTVYVGIIDEGFQYSHPDLDANSWTNPYDPVDGVDNDGNGRIDDIHGWDFWFGDNSTYDGVEDDHGTHVAGTIGGEGGNGAGVAGVNWNVQMISAKFLGPSGGSTAGAIGAVNYLTDLKTRHGLNIVATNNSWGGGGYSQGLHEAIIRGAKAGILFIAAAGNANSDNDSKPFYPAHYSTLIGTPLESPASYEAVISVASIASNGTRSSFSNYGATSVDLGAPGSSIISTVPVSAYASYNGTSMATPHVAGAAALYAAAYPTATAAQIRDALLNGVTPTPSLSGITVTGGRLNVWSALQIAPGIGVSITDVTLTEGTGAATSFTFTVSLASPVAGTVTVNFATADGTASAPGDYTAASGTVTFAPGDTSETITITVNGDALSESDETFFVNLSNPSSGCVLTDSQGRGTIINDDSGGSLPGIAIDVDMRFEGHFGLTSFTFHVTLTASSTQTVAVNYTTMDGTATVADNDYVPASGVLTFAPGVTSLTLVVFVVGDFRGELNETFSVDLSNAVNATIDVNQGIGTIVNDDLGFPGGGGGGGGVIGRNRPGNSGQGRGGLTRSAQRQEIQVGKASSAEQYAQYLFTGAHRRDADLPYQLIKPDARFRRGYLWRD